MQHGQWPSSRYIDYDAYYRGDFSQVQSNKQPHTELLSSFISLPAVWGYMRLYVSSLNKFITVKH